MLTQLCMTELLFLQMVVAHGKPSQQSGFNVFPPTGVNCFGLALIPNVDLFAWRAPAHHIHIVGVLNAVYR